METEMYAVRIDVTASARKIAEREDLLRKMVAAGAATAMYLAEKGYTTQELLHTSAEVTLLRLPEEDTIEIIVGMHAMASIMLGELTQKYAELEKKYKALGGT